MRCALVGTIRNVKGRQRETPHGKSPLGDALWWARKVGEFGSQEAFASKAGIGRIEVVKLEKGDSKGNSHQVMTAISKALGQPYPHFDAYIRGAYGPPSEDAARRFMSGEPPPTTEGTPARVSGSVATALFNLSYKLAPARFLIVRDIAAGLRFDHPDAGTPEGAERLLLGMEAETRGKSSDGRETSDAEEGTTGKPRTVAQLPGSARAKPSKKQKPMLLHQARSTGKSTGGEPGKGTEK